MSFRPPLTFIIGAIVLLAGVVIAAAALVSAWQSSVSVALDAGEMYVARLTMRKGETFGNYVGRAESQLHALQRLWHTTPPLPMNVSEPWYDGYFTLMLTEGTSVGNDLHTEITVEFQDTSFCSMVSYTLDIIFTCRRPNPLDALRVDEFIAVVNRFTGAMTTSTRTIPAAAGLLAEPTAMNAVKNLGLEGIVSLGVALSASKTPPYFSIKIAGPVHNAQGHCVGSLAVFASMELLHDLFIARDREAVEDRSFIIDDRGLVVFDSGAPELAEDFRTPNLNSDWVCLTNRNETGCLLKASAFHFAPVRAAIARESAFTSYEDLFIATISADGKKWFAVKRLCRSDLINFNTGKLQDIWLFTFVPHSSVTQEVESGVLLATNICAVVTVIVVIFTVATIGIFVKPLGTLATKMHEAATLKIAEGEHSDDDDVVGGSWIHEIDSLSKDFQQLKGELKQLKQFVPRSLMTKRQASSSGRLPSDSNTPSGAGSKTTLTIDSEEANAYDDKFRISLKKLAETVNLFVPVTCSIVYISVPDLPVRNTLELGEVISGLLERFVRTALSTNGSVESMNPDQLVVAYNAQSMCKNHEHFAMLFAEDMLPHLPTAQSTIVVDTVECYVGNCGGGGHVARVVVGATEAARKIAVLGQTFLSARLLITERTAKKYISSMNLIPVDRVVMMPKEDEPEPPLVLYELPRATRGPISEKNIETLRRAFNSLCAPTPDIVTAKTLLSELNPPEVDGAKGTHTLRLRQICEALEKSAILAFLRAEVPSWPALADKPWAGRAGEEEEAQSCGDTPFRNRLEEQIEERLHFKDEPEDQPFAEESMEAVPLVSLFGGPVDGPPGAGDVPTTFEDIHETEWIRSIRPIAQGATATVYLCISYTGLLGIAKCFAGEVAIEKVKEEALTACALRHENIVSYTSCAITDAHTFIITEYAPGGSLRELREQYGALPLVMVQQFMVGALKGLAYLHSKGVVHCDVKPHNILLGLDGVIKLADFGSSILVTMSSTRFGDVFNLRGTSWYMAPEVAFGDPPTFHSDMWSLAVTLLEMIVGRVPWPHALTAMGDALFIRELSRKDIVPEIPADLPDSMAEMLQQCLRRDPRERPTAEQVLSSAFAL